jgi:hypothetical protein
MVRWCGTDWGGEQPDERCVAMIGGEPLIEVDLEVVPDDEEDEWQER